MAEAAQDLRERGRWRLAWAALRGHREARAEEAEESVSFAELVWAHHERQKKVYDGEIGGTWENEYRRRLRLFTREHGALRESYWCRYEASGVALTEKQQRRRLTSFYRREWVLRLHTATDWRTANAPLIASWLHHWETAGIRASEVLRDTSERICLEWIFAASSRLLGFVDREPGDKIGSAELQRLGREQKREYDVVIDYYRRAGENSARIVYFKGMLWGTALLALLVATSFFVGWGLDLMNPRDEATYTLFVCIAMGAAGAVLSVMTRMAKDGFNLEFEVGRKSVRYLGGLRPWIGALFALALYLALKSSLIELLQGQAHGIYFYATVSFLAGFSERRAKVLLDSSFGADVLGPEPPAGPAPKPRAGGENEPLPEGGR